MPRRHQDGSTQGPCCPQLGSPRNVHDLQNFLGFVNYTRDSFRMFHNKLCLSVLLQKTTEFHYLPQAQHTFEQLKLGFTTPPVLAHADTAQTFIVEANASSTEIRAVFCQCHGPKQILHSITCYSRKLTPAEQNYEILDKEHLAIKTAFEKWQYYLKRACYSIQVCTDQKNLEYLCRAMVLNQ